MITLSDITLQVAYNVAKLTEGSATDGSEANSGESSGIRVDGLALAGLPKAERIAGYKALFASDPRIAGTVDSESAKAQIEADVSFPVTVNL